MKRIITIFTCLCCLMVVNWAEAQYRYTNEIFDEVEVTRDVTYGENGTVLLFPANGARTVKQNLKMDIYEPLGDTETARPLVLVFHTGNFLPSISNGQIAGTKLDSSSVEICTQLAKRGFVAASVTYRQGWNPLAETQPIRALGLIQAAYRGVQDGRTAVRFFKKTEAEDGNPYGIDPDKIVAWGNGTGGYLVLGMAGLSDYNEILQTTNGPGKFLLDLNGDQIPETPMVAQAYHGDIEGKVVTVVPDGAFGQTAGDTSNYANHVNYSSDYNMTVNVGGALGDISWLNDESKPILSIQSVFDQFAPYDDAILIVPTTGDPIVQVQGAKSIGEWMESSGTNQAYKDANFSDPTTAEAMDNAVNFGMHSYTEGSFPFYAPPNSNDEDEGIAINWWDPTDIPGGTYINDAITLPTPCMVMGTPIPLNLCPHPSDTSMMTSFHEEGLLLNEGMSAAKARKNIDKVMDYFTPRACVTLGLECNGVTSYEEPLLNNTAISLTPNPTNSEFTVTSSELEPILSIEVFNLEGRLIISERQVLQSQKTLNLSGQAPGMYIVKAHMEKGVVARKLMLE